MSDRTKKLYRQPKLWIVLTGTIFLFLFILNTNPNDLSLPLLLLPPLSIFIIIYFLSSTLLKLLTGIPSHNQTLISLVIAASPVILLLLASLGQLTPRDTILALVFMVGMAFYFSRFNSSA